MGSIEQYFNKKVFIMLLLGFSAGIPILLIFSSLSLWLNEAGLKKSAVTMFSWAALGYSFKFIWAPLIDQMPTPWLTNILGRRRSWLLISQFSIILSILLMANINPATGSSSLEYMAIAAVLLGFSSADNEKDKEFDSFLDEMKKRGHIMLSDDDLPSNIYEFSLN